MTALEKIRDWIKTFPGYDILADFQVDYTDQMTANSGGIFPSGLVEVGRTADIMGTVTVTNHSNRAVKVTFEYESVHGFDGIKGTFSVASDTLSAGVEGNVSGADSVSTTLKLSGSLASDIAKFTKVGSVTVSLQ